MHKKSNATQAQERIAELDSQYQELMSLQTNAGGMVLNVLAASAGAAGNPPAYLTQVAESPTELKDLYTAAIKVTKALSALVQTEIKEHTDAMRLEMKALQDIIHHEDGKKVNIIGVRH